MKRRRNAVLPKPITAQAFGVKPHPKAHAAAPYKIDREPVAKTKRKKRAKGWTGE